MNHFEQKNIQQISNTVFKKKFRKGYSKVHELKLVSIGLASPEKIQSWAEKELPNGKIFGEVKNANTFHYRTFQPTKGGLFCERIFGPLKDFECACGKRQKPTAFESKKILEHKQTTRYFCSNCDVEYTWSILRRYQLGYIRLHAPVTHLWYLKTNPSYLSIFFDMKRKDLESVIYCIDSITLENMWKLREQKANSHRPISDLYKIWQNSSNLDKQKKMFSKNFKNKKKKTQIFREKLFEQFFTFMDYQPNALQSTLMKKQQNLPFLHFADKAKEKNNEKNAEIFQNKNFLRNIEKTKFFIFNSNFLKNEKFSYAEQQKSIQTKIFQKIVEEKQKKILFFAFEKIFQKAFQKRYGNQIFEIFLKEKISKKKFVFDFFSNFLFFQKFEKKNFFLFFFFSLKYSFSLISENKKQNPLLFFFKFEKKEFLSNKKRNSQKKVFLFLFTIISFFKKMKLTEQKVQKRNLLKKKNLFFFSTTQSKLQISYIEQQKNKEKNEFLSMFVQPLKKKINFQHKEKKKYFLSFERIFSNTKNRGFFNFGVEVFFDFQNQIKICPSFQNQNHDFIACCTMQAERAVQKTFFVKQFQSPTKKQSIYFNPIKQTHHVYSEALASQEGMTSHEEKEAMTFSEELNSKCTLLFFAQPQDSAACIAEEAMQVEQMQQAKQPPQKYEKKKIKIQILNTQNEQKKKKSEKKKQMIFQQFQKFGNLESSLKSFFPFFSDFFENKQKNQKHEKKEKNKKFQTSNFLKNPVLTISYNFLWKNDSDWNYFVYYNSFFFTEFQDFPIFYFSSRNVFSSFSTNFFLTEFTPSLAFGPGVRSYFLQNSLSTEPLQSRHFMLQDQQNKKGIQENISYTERAEQQALKKKISVGAGIVEKFLIEYTSSELKKMMKQHQILLPKLNQAIRFLKQKTNTKKEFGKIQKYLQKREHILRRLKFLRKFSRKNSNPTFMILRNLPVLPPDLRPILKLQNQIAASDLNRFYQRILYRNERLKKFSKDSVTNQSFEIKYAQRLLQEAVDNLIQNGKGGVKPETNSRGQPLKSLSEILKGKQGRFRQYLLGKRVDYSGRSVIVVGPKLKLHECGLPKEMAFELFLPFLIQRVLQLNFTKTVIGAKNLLKKDSDFAFHLLKKIMKNSPVLLNRAPTLHRLGFQAFLPKLIEGRAILLHPMVCPGFNADFDGDQMAVHIPLTVEARTEAWKFMLSTNNFINSATGEPILLPTQDMVLGCYSLTTDFQSKGAAFQILNSLKKQISKNFSDFQISNKSFLFFHNVSEVFSAYSRKEIELHTPIWIRWNGFVDFGKTFTKPVEIQLQKNGSWHLIHSKFTTFHTEKNEIFSKFIRTTPGRILMNFMIQDFEKNVH